MQILEPSIVLTHWSVGLWGWLSFLVFFFLHIFLLLSSFLGRHEVERSEGLLSLPGCGRASYVICRSPGRQQWTLKLKTCVFLLLLKIELSYLKQCFGY